MLGRPNQLHQDGNNLYWCPCYQCYNANFQEEDVVHVACLEVGFEEYDRHEVSCRCGDHEQDHLHVDVVDLSVHI